MYAGSGGTNNPTKHYIDTVLPGFKATYTRQTITCTCPSDTNLDGTSFTLYDKTSCPGIGIHIVGGSDEWKTTHCGGLKPVYGCTDSRASNYNQNVVQDPADTDVCNPKYCTYPTNVILPECQPIGGDDMPGSGGSVGDAPPADDNGADEPPDPPPGGTGGFNPPSGGGNDWGDNNWNIQVAENVIRPSKLINTSQSFLNW